MDDRAQEVIRMALSYLAADLEAACLNYRLEDENPTGDYMAVDNHTMLRPTAEEVMDLLEQFREEEKPYREYDVFFTVSFTTRIKVHDGEGGKDVAARDINIPANAECQYVEDSFELRGSHLVTHES